MNRFPSGLRQQIRFLSTARREHLQPLRYLLSKVDRSGECCAIARSANRRSTGKSAYATQIPHGSSIALNLARPAYCFFHLDAVIHFYRLDEAHKSHKGTEEK